MNTLPAGLLPTDTRVEFFASHEMGACMLNGGRTLTAAEFDEELKNIIREDMLLHPAKVAGIRAMGVAGEAETISQYLVCNYGGFDNRPDLVDGKLQAKEYWNCPKRGTCAFDGIVCQGLLTTSGKEITPTEIQVLKRIADGQLDKEIAAGMGVAITTVATHTRNIRRKTGLLRKAELTKFATDHKLI